MNWLKRIIAKIAFHIIELKHGTQYVWVVKDPAVDVQEFARQLKRCRRNQADIVASHHQIGVVPAVEVKDRLYQEGAFPSRYSLVKLFKKSLGSHVAFKDISKIEITSDGIVVTRYHTQLRKPKKNVSKK